MRRSAIVLVGALLGAPVALAQQGTVNEQARAAKTVGDKLYNEKKLKEAAESYQKAVTLDPKYTEAWDTLGNLYYEQSNFEKAIEAYQGGVRASGTYTLGLYNIAYCYNTLGKYKESAAAYKVYLGKVPDDLDALYSMAGSLSAGSDNAAALAAFEEYVKKEKRPESSAQLDKAKQEISRLKPAEATKPAETPKPTEATKQPEATKKDPVKPAETKADPKPTEASKTTNPGDAPSLSKGEPDVQPQSKPERAKGYKKEGDDLIEKQKWALAAESYRKATLLDPAYLDAWDSLGNTYVAQEEYSRAIEAYKGGLVADTNYVLGYYNMAYCQRALGQYSNAIIAYRTFLLKVPDDPDALFGLAASLGAVSDNATAISTYEKYLAIESRPDTAEFVQTAKKEITRLKAKSKGIPAEELEPATPPEKPSNTSLDVPEVTKAKASLAAPAELPAINGPLPESAQESIAIGDAYFAKRAFDSSVTYYSQAVTLSGGNLEAHYKLGVTLALLKDYPNAIAHLSRALEGDPTNKHIRSRLNRVIAMAATEDANSLAKGETLPFTPGEEAKIAADSYMKEGRYVLALEYYDTAVSYAPKDAAAHQGRGDALVSLARSEEAKEEYLYAISLEPQDAKPYRALGDLHRLRNETKQAKYYYQLYLLRVKATTENTKEIASIRSYVAQNK